MKTLLSMPVYQKVVKCECDVDLCGGNTEFCSFRKCSTTSDCKCKLIHQTPQILAVTNDMTLYNLQLII